jgi:UDP-3-O-[3-hydroxymyristoyl] glucosamine N-acyltransferase
MFHRISPKADIHPTAKIAEFVSIRDYCVIGEGTQIGSFVVLGAGTFIGRNCEIHGGAMFADQGKHFNKDVLAPILGNNVKFGTSVKVMAGVHIGNNVEVGANSTVMCDIPDGELWAGTPARKIR